MYIIGPKSMANIEYKAGPVEMWKRSMRALQVKKRKCNNIMLPISVLPVPGGPKRRSPLGGPLSPVNMSLW